MKLIGALLWIVGILMAGAGTSQPEHIQFTVNVAGLLAFISGSLIIYKEHKDVKK